LLVGLTASLTATSVVTGGVPETTLFCKKVPVPAGMIYKVSVLFDSKGMKSVTCVVPTFEKMTAFLLYENTSIAGNAFGEYAKLAKRTLAVVSDGTTIVF